MSDQLVINEPEKGSPTGHCCPCGHHHWSGVVRAALYMPIVLLLGGYVAIAMFPDLAEHATPLLDRGKKTDYVCSAAVSDECMRQMMLKSSTCSLPIPPASTEVVEAEPSFDLPADPSSAANVEQGASLD